MLNSFLSIFQKTFSITHNNKLNLLNLIFLKNLNFSNPKIKLDIKNNFNIFNNLYSYSFEITSNLLNTYKIQYIILHLTSLMR